MPDEIIKIVKLEERLMKITIGNKLFLQDIPKSPATFAAGKLCFPGRQSGTGKSLLFRYAVRAWMRN